MTAPLVVVSGPSGVGKSTVVQAVLRQAPDVWLSVSATTRAPRPGEVDGEHYCFVSQAEFDTLIATGRLLEWAQFAGNRYGTPRGPVEEHRERGTPVILEIELAGARQVRAGEPDARLVFLAPPSWEVLEARLRGRGTEAEEAVRERLATAGVEMSAQGEFDDIVVNTDVEEAARTLVGFLHDNTPR
ncbi:MAG: guanylate kinase [Candidatus Nanopelagicales bacterium]|nr:guanylate kinase [Candidatus Nanopelagicales bacterium]